MIREDNLIEQAVTSGAYLHDRMLEMHEKYPGSVGAPRAKGLIQAWDCQDPETRDAIIAELKL